MRAGPLGQWTAAGGCRPCRPGPWWTYIPALACPRLKSSFFFLIGDLLIQDYSVTPGLYRNRSVGVTRSQVFFFHSGIILDSLLWVRLVSFFLFVKEVLGRPARLYPFSACHVIFQERSLSPLLFPGHPHSRAIFLAGFSHSVHLPPASTSGCVWIGHLGNLAIRRSDLAPPRARLGRAAQQGFSGDTRNPSRSRSSYWCHL